MKSVARLTAAFMAFLMAASCLPLLGPGTAYADDEYYEDVKLSKEEAAKLGLKKGETREVLVSDDDKVVKEAEQEAIAEAAEKEGVIPSADGGMTLNSADEDLSDPAAEKAKAFKADEDQPEIEAGRFQPISEDGIKLQSSEQPDPSKMGFTVSAPNNIGYVNLIGVITEKGWTIDSIYMDNAQYSSNLIANVKNQSVQINNINMKKYDVGFHTVLFYLSYNGTIKGFFPVHNVPSYVYGAPSNSYDQWTTTQKKIGASCTSGDQYCEPNNEYLDLYMQYKVATKKGKWSTYVYGPVTTSYNTVSYIPKRFASNKNYSVRFVYGKRIEYEGKAYFFSGLDTGRYSRTCNVWTAHSKKQLKKLIKSIKIKAKVKSLKYYAAYKYTYYWWGYRTHYKKKRAYYTINTATVSFKKKPTVGGVYLRTKYGTVLRKGNRKKYSVKFLESGRKKKRRKISVKTYRSAYYGGYSPFYGKTVKAH